MKYIVWIWEKGRWVENGEGQLTEREANRIARETRQDFNVRTLVRPVGFEPPQPKEVR